MPVSLLLRSSVALAALAFAGAVLAQPMGMGRGAPKTFIAGTGPDEMWDVTTKMEMPGMPMAMPAQTHQSCIKKGRNTAEASIPKDENCRVTDMKTSGNKVTWAMECKGEEPMSGRGEITSTGNAYDGRMQMKSTRRGQDMEMTMTFSGKRTGACTDQSEQMVASMKAQGEAQMDKVCADASGQYQYTLFGKGQPCESRKKAFCDKVGGNAGTMREPAGFRTVVAKPGVPAIRGSFEVCGLDFDGTAKAACGKAVGSRDWAFVGNGACDADVRAQGPTYCKGRDYYLVDRSLVPMCNRYAALTRGGGAATAGASGGGASGGGSGAPASGSAPKGSSSQTASAPPPEPPKADPVKQGVDAVRRLLPF